MNCKIRTNQNREKIVTVPEFKYSLEAQGLSHKHFLPADQRKSGEGSPII